MVKYENVRFDSFVKLANFRRSDRQKWGFITLKYNGTDLYGDLTIDAYPGESKKRAEFIKIAAEILQLG